MEQKLVEIIIAIVASGALSSFITSIFNKKYYNSRSSKLDAEASRIYAQTGSISIDNMKSVMSNIKDMAKGIKQDLQLEKERNVLLTNQIDELKIKITDLETENAELKKKISG